VAILADFLQEAVVNASKYGTGNCGKYFEISYKNQWLKLRNIQLKSVT